jgi:CxxC motif-containing protein (DUF1111 family)
MQKTITNGVPKSIILSLSLVLAGVTIIASQIIIHQGRADPAQSVVQGRLPQSKPSAMQRIAPPKPEDPAAVKAGEELFRHEWIPFDPLVAGGDGLGPVYNATSCAACHFQNGVGGSGGLAQNVTVFSRRLNRFGSSMRRGTVDQGTVHAYSTLGRAETLQDLNVLLPPVSRPGLALVLAVTGSLARRDRDGSKELLLLGGQPLPFAQPPLNSVVSMAVFCADCGLQPPNNLNLSQRNTVALFGAKLIDDIPEADIIAGAERVTSVQRDWRNCTGFDRRISRMVDTRIGRFGWKAQSPTLAEFVRAACANELGLSNSGHDQPLPLFNTEVQPCANDLTDLQCSQLTAFIASLPRPVERVPNDPRAAEAATAGKKLFHSIGCADCHAPNLGQVQGLYSDLLLHDMGSSLEGGGSYLGDRTVKPSEWRTPPLWGVADSAPYLHDGRAATLAEAILLHRGDGYPSVIRFTDMSDEARAQVISFLQTLRAPDQR